MTPDYKDLSFTPEEMQKARRALAILRAGWTVLKDEFGKEWVNQHCIMATGVSKNPPSMEMQVLGMALGIEGMPANAPMLAASVIIAGGQQMEADAKGKLPAGEGIKIYMRGVASAVDALATFSVMKKSDTPSEQ